MSLAMDYRDKPRTAAARARRIPPWLLLTAVSVILIGLASLGAAVLFDRGPVAIESPEREMGALLKECKLTVTLKPAQTTGAIVTGRGGAEWYACSLTPVECDALLEAMHARVDGRNAKISTHRGDGAQANPPQWWTPQTARDLTAIEVDPPTFWVAVSKTEGKMFLRRVR